MATQSDKVNNGALFTLTAVGGAALIAIYFGLHALVRHQEAMTAEERLVGADSELQALRQKQQTRLNAAPKVVGGKISLPIDVAMQRVVSDLQRDPRSATPFVQQDAGADAAPPALDAATTPDDAGADAAATGETPPAAEQGTTAPIEPSKPQQPGQPEDKKQDVKKSPKPGATLGQSSPNATAPQPSKPEGAPAPAPAPAPAAPTE